MAKNKLEFLSNRDKIAFANMPRGDIALIASGTPRILRLSRPVGTLGLGSVPETHIATVSRKTAEAIGQKLLGVKRSLEGGDDSRMVKEIFVLINDFFPWLYFAFESTARNGRLNWLRQLTDSAETAQDLSQTLKVGWLSSPSRISEELIESINLIKMTAPGIIAKSHLHLLSDIDPKLDAKAAIEKVWKQRIGPINGAKFTTALQQKLFFADFTAVPQAIHSELAKLLLILPDTGEQEKAGRNELLQTAEKLRDTVSIPVLQGISEQQT